jgi:hypothetical protein
MSQASLTSLVSCFRLGPDPTQVEHLKEAPLLCRLLVLATNMNKVEMLARDKHSSLLRTFVNYGRKKFYNIVSSGQSHKTILP